MGFFDKILKGLGFESEEKNNPKPKKEIKRKAGEYTLDGEEEEIIEEIELLEKLLAQKRARKKNKDFEM